MRFLSSLSSILFCVSTIWHYSLDELIKRWYSFSALLFTECIAFRRCHKQMQNWTLKDRTLFKPFLSFFCEGRISELVLIVFVLRFIPSKLWTLEFTITIGDGFEFLVLTSFYWKLREGCCESGMPTIDLCSLVHKTMHQSDDFLLYSCAQGNLVRKCLHLCILGFFTAVIKDF